MVLFKGTWEYSKYFNTLKYNRNGITCTCTLCKRNWSIVSNSGLRSIIILYSPDIHPESIFIFKFFKILMWLKLI